jgi:putative ATPase
MTHVMSIVGARPQFIKASVVSAELARIGVHETLVHTGQHYDYVMSEVFFRELPVRPPDHNLGIGSGGHGAQAGGMMHGIEMLVSQTQPDRILVYGDTNSTLAGALVGAKLCVPVDHVEAGLRSFDRDMPEEVNRVLTDHVSDLLFCPTATSVRNLAREGVHDGVSLVGDVMLDLALQMRERALTTPLPAAVEEGSYFVATIHRPANTDSTHRLEAIVSALREVSARVGPVILSAHPRLRGRLAEGAVMTDGLQLISPLGYLEMQGMLLRARGVITDSGGIQKEALFHGVRCVTLRDSTEWVESLDAGMNELIGNRLETLVEAAGRCKGRVSTFHPACSVRSVVVVLALLSRIRLSTPAPHVGAGMGGLTRAEHMPRKGPKTLPAKRPRDPSLFSPPASAQPLAARMRPRTLEEFAGQAHLVGPGKPLRDAIERGTVGSMILWGPPGSGKTTLAFLIAKYTDREFVPFSSVTEGVPRVREIIAEAEARLETGRGTILFADEIHRLNKAQQDAFLPHVETGTITLIGATTENPSFEIIGALLSRSRVFVLHQLETSDIDALVRRALADTDRGVGALTVTADDDAIHLIATEADGDARRALTVLEAAVSHVGPGGHITGQVARDALQKRFARYDKAGEEHYNLISAYHKALRGSDPQGALYWLARMIDGGEDPMYIARRTVRFAAEDVGLADPDALRIAIAARDAYHFLGSPEGELAIAEAAVYLATAPKSNRVYEAWNEALRLARESPAEPVPMHIRNAPTGLMKELGYGEGYQYAHAVPEAYIPQEYLPVKLRGTLLYEPGPFGFERAIAKRLAWWSELRARATGHVPSEERREDPNE